MMKREPVVESKVDDQFSVDPDDLKKMQEYMNKAIGRYPPGFRHYENFENYQIINPGATIQDYHDESKKISK